MTTRMRDNDPNDAGMPMMIEDTDFSGTPHAARVAFVDAKFGLVDRHFRAFQSSIVN